MTDNPREHLLFVGAGASAEFGVPTMQEMVSKFREKLNTEKTDLQGLYDKICEAARKAGVDPDLETVLSILTGISNVDRPSEIDILNKLFLTESKLFSSEDKALSQTLLEQIFKFVQEVCYIDPDGAEKGSKDKFSKKIKDLYEKLFKAVELINIYQELSNQIIFTTNYDNAFDILYEQSPEGHTLFTREGGGMVLKNIQDTYMRGGVQIANLHGSLSWRRKEGCRDIIQVPPGRSSFGGSDLYPASILIYPVKQKEMYVYPWLDLFFLFRRALYASKVLIFIGYSFNDVYLRSLVDQCLKREFQTGSSLELNSLQTKMFIVDRSNGEKIKEKFSKEVQDQIQVIDKPFSGCFKELHAALYPGDKK